MVAFALQPNQVTFLGFPLKILTPTILRQKNKKIKCCCISSFRGSLFIAHFGLCMVLQHTPFTSHVTPVTFSMSFPASLQPQHQAFPLGHQSTLHWEQCWYRKLRGRACDQTCGTQGRHPSLGIYQKLLLGEGASAPCHATR